ncbi:MAG: hypothetical protein KAI83_11295 [Thiomargarita sp.]|nr:hypothetical protein [Thiomargarita sp.]
MEFNASALLLFLEYNASALDSLLEYNASALDSNFNALIFKQFFYFSFPNKVWEREIV